jgi:hypothetical protein
MTNAPDSGAATPDEQRLLDALRRALPLDRLPPGLLERAEQLVTYLDVDRELAELLAQPAEAAGMRGGGSGTALTFGTADGTVSVDVTVDRTTVSGQVLAGAPMEVDLEPRSGPVAVGEVDELGSFAFYDVLPGPTRLILRTPAREVVTDWFLM